MPAVVRARVHVRAQGDADLAPGAAAEGRRHRGGRRGGRRDRDGAGVRPRGRRAGALRAARRRRCATACCARRASRPRSCPGCCSCRRSRSRAVVLFGGRDVIGGTLTYGEFFLFYQLLLQLVWPLEALGWILSLAPARDRVGVAQLRLAAGDRDDPRADAPDRAAGAAALGVTFEDVHFSYGTGSEVLSGVELEIAPGEVIAVCGPTGAGKTSLLNLLPRFYDPTDGRVLVGGVDVRDVPLAELRARGRDRHAEADPLLDPAARQPHRRAPRRAVGRGRRRLRGGRRRAVRRRAARRLRHADRRARRQPLGRPAPARRARARARRRRARRRARRPDVGGRHADRAPPRREPPPRARRAHRADRDAAALDGRGRRPRGRARRRRGRRVGHAARAARARAASSPRSSARKSVPQRKRRTGLTRLGRYLVGRCACASRCSRSSASARRRPRWRRCSSCRTRSTTACRRTTSRGSPATSSSTSSINALAWILQTTLVRGLARVGQDVVLGLRRRSLRPPDDALAALLLAAEGRLDHRAADLRRRRALRRPLAGADDARRQHADAARGDRRPLRPRLAARRSSRS